APQAPVVQQPVAPPPATLSRGNQQVAVIQFGAGSAGLTSNDFTSLERVAEMQRTNRATVRIVAHAQQDAAGSSADQLARANYEISRQRALTVAHQLVRLGVAGTPIRR